MMHILCFDIPADNIPSIPNASVEAARRPHMLAAPLLEMGEFFSQDPARPSFHRNFDYLNTQFFAGFTDDALRDHRDIVRQYLSSIFRGETIHIFKRGKAYKYQDIRTKYYSYW